MSHRAKTFFAITSATFFILLAGCRSHHIEIKVENRTGSIIRLLEVDYPSASFGADSVEAGDTVQQSVQVQGSGPVKVQYTTKDKHLAQMTGPALSEGQEGKLQIVLLPGDKAEFRN